MFLLGKFILMSMRDRLSYILDQGGSWERSVFVVGLIFGGLLCLVGCGEPPVAKTANTQPSSVNTVVAEKPLDVKVGALLEEAEGLKVKGRYAEAVAVYEKVIQARPDMAESYFRLGVLYFNLGLKSKSEENYLKAVEKDYRNPEIYFHMGYIKESESKLQEALEWYLKAEEKGVGSAELFFNIGNVYARLDNPEKAVDYYKKAVSINPKHVDGFINLSIIAFQRENYLDASFYLDKAKELGYVPPDDYLKALSIKMLSN